MASREKLISSPNFPQPTAPEMINRLNSSTLLERRIVFLIYQVDTNLYSFICGIVTNLPISVLFEFLNMDVKEVSNKWLLLILYTLLLIDTVVMTVAAFRFTLFQIAIKEKARREQFTEAYTNTMYNQIFDSMRNLRLSYKAFIISVCLFVLFVTALFFVNNFDFNRLLDSTDRTVEPLVTQFSMIEH